MIQFSLVGIGVSTNGVTILNQDGTLVYSNANDVDDVSRLHRQ